MILSRILLATAFACLSIGLPEIASAKPMQLTTSDGQQLQGNMTGRGTHGVLLIHGRNSSGAAWKLFAEKLVAKGYRVLALDLRGHGESSTATANDDSVFPLMVHDLQAGLKALKTYKVKSISIVGADIGANLALHAAAEESVVTNVALLSPGINIKGILASAPISKMGERPVLLAASEQDNYAKRSVTFLSSKAPGIKQLILSEGDANGIRMMDEDPGLEDSVLNWVAGNYGAAASSEQDQSIRTGDVQEMKSTGKSFGE